MAEVKALHTPESLAVNFRTGQLISTYNHQLIATLPSIETLSGSVYPTQEFGNITENVYNRQANGERLAACWNACKGIPTEALEAGVIEAESKAVRGAQELLAAWIVPNSTISDKEVLSSLLEVLDAQKLVKLQRMGRSNG